MSADPVLILDGHDIGEAAMARLAEDCARAARPGDLIALEGDLGAGKTTFARAFLRALAGDPAMEVPSPTFTLVQSYDLALPVLHADLYRIADPAEVDDLGLDDGRDRGVVLVEWPDRSPDLAHRATLTVALSGSGDIRSARLAASGDAAARFSRTLAIRDFLTGAGMGDAERRPLAGDASTRSYETVHPRGPGDVLVLMNAPRTPDGPPIRDGLPYSRLAHLAESVTPFVAIDEALRGAGFCAPQIIARDLDAGLLLIEDLGRDGVLDAERRPIAERYQAAAELLADLHGCDWPRAIALAEDAVHQVPPYSRRAMLIETELFLDWYVPERTGAPATPALREGWLGAWNAVLDSLSGGEETLVLRDYHSPNLIWRGERSGNDRIGLIDFQDAVIGPAAYDVASLARDARVDIAPALESTVVAAYVARRHARGPFDEAAFRSAFAVMAAQRNAKILGIFHRLHRRDGKPAYLAHLPRIERYFAASLADPALAPVRAVLDHAGIAFEGAVG